MVWSEQSKNRRFAIRKEHRAGFTITEVMAVLVVTSLIFLSSIAIISQQQNRTEFATSVQDFQTRMQQTIDDVINGYYPSNSDFTCAVKAGTLTVVAGNTAKGANQGCIYIGKA